MGIQIFIQGNVMRVELNALGASEHSVLKSMFITKTTPVQYGIVPFPFEGELYGADVIYADVLGRRNYLHFSMFDESMNFA